MDAGTMYANAKALHELLQEERVESAKLRHDLEEANNQAEEVCIENAKLRELVRIAGTYCVNGLCGKDDGCPLYLGKPYCALPDRMRDLGIEVDE